MKPWNFIVSLVITVFSVMGASAQGVLFDFDNAPLHASLPVDQTAGGITAHLSATAPGYSIQEANALGFTPQGFTGRVIYPNGINRADLLIRFDQTLTGFSIMYSCQELGCDDAATMRVTAYMHGGVVGTNTKTASHPGTWPVDTLSCTVPQGFDSVVVHYDSRPPTCQDYGTIFLADNMRVSTAVGAVTAADLPPKTFSLSQNYPNPFNPATTIRYSLPHRSHVTLVIFSTLGQKVAEIVNSDLEAGEHEARFIADNLASGMYFYRLSAAPRAPRDLVPGEAHAAQAGIVVETRKLVISR